MAYYKATLQDYCGVFLEIKNDSWLHSYFGSMPISFFYLALEETVGLFQAGSKSTGQLFEAELEFIRQRNSKLSNQKWLQIERKS